MASRLTNNALKVTEDSQTISFQITHAFIEDSGGR